MGGFFRARVGSGRPLKVRFRGTSRIASSGRQAWSAVLCGECTTSDGVAFSVLNACRVEAVAESLLGRCGAWTAILERETLLEEAVLSDVML